MSSKKKGTVMYTLYHALTTVLVYIYSVNVQQDGVDSLITLSEGDMRRALNILQVNFTSL